MLQKLNYHSRELTELHGSLAYSLLNPWKSTASRVDQWYMERYASEYEGLSGEVHRFDAAREVHERLSEWLGARKTMGGSEIVEEEEKEGLIEEINEEEDVIRTVRIFVKPLFSRYLLQTRESNNCQP